jgi:hypothetical protein
MFGAASCLPAWRVQMDIPTCTLILTAAVTGYIAWQQWQTARNKLRLDLFDRRFPVFEAAMKLVWIAVTKGNVPDEARREFMVATKGVQFLFDQELQDHCDALAAEALNVRVGSEKIESLPVGEERAKSEGARADRITWFNDQVDEIPKRFAPFLKIHG